MSGVGGIATVLECLVAPKILNRVGEMFLWPRWACRARVSDLWAQGVIKPKIAQSFKFDEASVAAPLETDAEERRRLVALGYLADPEPETRTELAVAVQAFFLGQGRSRGRVTRYSR